jgi:hypothetical protein
MSSQNLAPYLRRLAVVLLISTFAVFLINEIGIRIQNESSARQAETVELVIPAGTAAKVDAGLDAPGIPAEMTFVLGDVLLVKNEDSVGHSLGPLLIPPGSQARMPLDRADNLALSCSFSASKYLGLDISPPTTLGTRLVGLGFAVPPTAAMVYVYSLLAFPINSTEDEKKRKSSTPKN